MHKRLKIGEKQGEGKFFYKDIRCKTLEDGL
jgi:hypothetical protein